MTGEPDFFTIDDVLLLHETQLARYGGGSGLRDSRALDAAVAMPRATFDGELLHADIYTMAALVFLDVKGITGADPAGRLHDAMIALAERRLDKQALRTCCAR